MDDPSPFSVVGLLGLYPGAVLRVPVEGDASPGNAAGFVAWSSECSGGRVTELTMGPRWLGTAPQGERGETAVTVRVRGRAAR